MLDNKIKEWLKIIIWGKYMQIGNKQTQSYGYNQNVNVANKNDSSNSFNNYLENKEENINTKKPTSNIIEYLDKKDKFSSFCKRI